MRVCQLDANDVVTADPRRGMLLLVVTQDRTEGVIKEDTVVFPGDARLVHATQCTSGLVFVLRFATSSVRKFFWIQEPHRDKAFSIISRFNMLLDNPHVAEEAYQIRSVETDPAFVSQLDDLRTMLDSVNVSGADSPSVSDDETDFTAILNPELVAPLLNNAQVAGVLFPGLPVQSGPWSNHQIAAVIASREFRNAVRSLRAAARSGAIEAIMQELGEAACERIRLFLAALGAQ
ncbi:adhesion regulating molecule 1 [Polyrhizophydium stewartii]|uniref:Adhesion regulating molecule 1 n=1 Tax=Polyrhizophydium stewartii TaxID=2732419 RepID=A0ABR4MZP8_9FUNG